jgi:tetratricopeptide (TPR) repeat protein
MDERERAQAQTARNVAALEHEQRGEWDAAVELYEANVAEGFAGDWPYQRLALLYTRRSQPADAVRVLERAVEVFQALPRSRPDRTARLRAFRQNLKEARRALATAGRSRGRAGA